MSGDGGQRAGARPPHWSMCAVIGCVALIVLLVTSGAVLILGRVVGTDSRPGTTTSASPDEGTPEADDQGDDGGTVTPEGQDSSANDPIDVGATVTMPTDGQGTFDITFGAPDSDAEQAILDAHPDNEPAPEGERYVQVPVTVTYHGEGAMEYWANIGVNYVDRTGAVHPVARGVKSARTAYAMGAFQDGTTAEHDLVFLIPADATGNGVADVHLVHSGADIDERVYVALE